MSIKNKTFFAGTLHIGSLCNENYRLYKALLTQGVNAHYVHFERLADKHYTSDPRAIDPNFKQTDQTIHTIPVKTKFILLQKIYELYSIGRIIRSMNGRFWVHAQTDFPIYVSFFTKDYSAHSSGSDLRKNFFRNGLKDRFLARAYKKARIVFYHNIDLYNHVLSRTHKSFNFIPNICEFPPLKINKKKVENDDTSLRIFMPSRITYYDEEDIKGNSVFFKVLENIRNINITLVLAKDDQNALKWSKEILSEYTNIKCEFVSSRSNKLVYYSEIEKADFIIDQFYLGAMGGIALESYSLEKIALVSIDPLAFRCCYGEDFALPEINSPSSLQIIINQLTNKVFKEKLEIALNLFVKRHHRSTEVANLFLGVLARQGILFRRENEG